MPTCKYRLDNTVYDVNGALPCWPDRVWTFVLGNKAPTEDGQVTCIVPRNPFNGSLAVSSFSAKTKACATTTARVNATVTPYRDYTCVTTLSLSAYTGS